MTEQLEEYIETHISSEPEYLKRLYRDTYLTTTYPHMCSGHIQGRLLSMLSTMMRPKRILELGTFTGYSALCLAEGLLPEGELHTIEIDDEFEQRLTDTFSSSPFAGQIHLHIGDALEIVPLLGSDWDIVFIDANKRNYIDYYEAVIERLSPGGVILADNTLWSGKVAVTPPPRDAQSRGILDFNEHVIADPRVNVAMIPVRDGITMIRRCNPTDVVL